jgi:hypothetical protein
MASRKGVAKTAGTPGKIAAAEDAARAGRALSKDASPPSVAKPKIGHNRGPPKPPRSRGEYGFSVPEAGAMVGLSLNSSYEAAKRGDIPTLKMGGVRIVPRLIWLRMLGVEPVGKTAA